MNTPTFEPDSPDEPKLPSFVEGQPIFAPSQGLWLGGAPVLWRYFNYYRVIIASAFVIFGSLFQLGQHAPQLFAWVVGSYWVAAVAFVWIRAWKGLQASHWLALQVLVDIFVLTVVMHSSGGQRTGMPFLMMVTIAGAGLVSEGRRVTFFAAVASIAVLIEQALRTFMDARVEVDFSLAGIIGMGFFAVALMARLLVRRAQENELLARERGHALQSQIRINARVIEDMLDGVLVADAQGTVLQANPRARQLLGMVLQAGDTLASIAPAVHDYFMRQSGGPLPVFRAERSGKLLRLRGLVSGEEGNQVFFLEDVERLQAQSQQMKLAALGRLTANIAHEIRNPLTSITQAAELLQEENRTEMRQRLMQIIGDNSARIERIVKEVLELGKRDSSTPEAIDLREFMQQFVDDLSVADPAVRHLIMLSIPSVWIRFDRIHLQQIVWNLIGNARTFCRPTPGAIRVWLDPLSETRVALHVHDNGPGIAESAQAKIFEPFFTTQAQGTGLGLYIARELAETNGGTLSLASSEEGADFYLTMQRMG